MQHTFNAHYRRKFLAKRYVPGDDLNKLIILDNTGIPTQLTAVV